MRRQSRKAPPFSGAPSRDPIETTHLSGVQRQGTHECRTNGSFTRKCFEVQNRCRRDTESEWRHLAIFFGVAIVALGNRNRKRSADVNTLNDVIVILAVACCGVSAVCGGFRVILRKHISGVLWKNRPGIRTATLFQVLLRWHRSRVWCRPMGTAKVRRCVGLLVCGPKSSLTVSCFTLACRQQTRAIRRGSTPQDV